MLKFLTATWRHLCFSEEQKLIFGLLFSLKATVSAMRPGNVDGKMPIEGLQVSCAMRWFCSQSARLPRKFVGSGRHANRNGKAQFCAPFAYVFGPCLRMRVHVQSYATSTYRLHYFETATGLRFILITNPNGIVCITSNSITPARTRSNIFYMHTSPDIPRPVLVSLCVTMWLCS